MRSLRPFLLMLTLVSLFAACSKSDADPYTGPGSTGTDTDTTVVNTCALAEEVYTQPSAVEPQWNLNYGANGNLANAGGYNASGIKTTNTLTGSTSIIATASGSTSTYTFDNDIFAGRPTQYSLTTGTGAKLTRSILYSNDSTISSITLSADTGAIATVTLHFGTGNLTQFQYQSTSGDSAFTVYIDTYDGNTSPMKAMKGTAFLFYNWEYFSTPVSQLGKLIQHLSTNNWTHYFCMQNGVKTLEESITYKYNSKGYPTSGAVHVVTYSGAGVATSDNTYTVTYLFPCQ